MLCQTTAFISLDNLEHNLGVVRGKINKDTVIMAAVKAEAYGHGLAAVSQKLYSLGVRHFAVACLDEALSLRGYLPESEILVLGFTHPSQAAVLSENRIMQALYSEDFAKELSHYCKINNVSVKTHIAFETGMGRIGFSDKESAVRAAKLDGIEVLGAFTHFPRADMTDDESVRFTKSQVEKFSDMVSHLKKEGIEPLVCHCANSAAAFKFPEFQFDMVRLGISLYGLAPNPDDEAYSELKPVMQLKTPISHINDVEKGATVGYGSTFIAPGKMRIATVPCGYADGYLRSLSSGYVLVHGKGAKILGRICMDQMMIDITDIPDAQLFDSVTLFGDCEGEYLSVNELAKLSNTINYEIICGITRRVIRVYE